MLVLSTNLTLLIMSAGMRRPAMQVSGLMSRPHSRCGLYVEVERGRGDCSPTPAQQARHGSGCRAAAATQHVERYRRWGNIISALLPLFLFTIFSFLPSSLFINYLLFQSYLPSPLSKSLRINYFQYSYTQIGSLPMLLLLCVGLLLGGGRYCPVLALLALHQPVQAHRSRRHPLPPSLLLCRLRTRLEQRTEGHPQHPAGPGLPGDNMPSKQHFLSQPTMNTSLN